MIEEYLDRIANALERIADALAPQTRSFGVDEVEHVPTLTKPPLEWFDAGNGCAVAVEDSIDAEGATMDKKTAQTTWEWLGITPPARRSRAKNPNTPPIFQKLPETGKQQKRELKIQSAILSKFGGSEKIAKSKNAGNRKKSTRGAERGNTRAGQCGRCGRAGRRRLNHQMFCIDCEHEDWWDE